jgi:hypothetical protein
MISGGFGIFYYTFAGVSSGIVKFVLCEIIGDFVYYLVPHGISIQVSSYRTFVLTCILAIGFKTPTRGFSQFSRNLN